MGIVKNVLKFLSEDLWRIRLKHESSHKSLWIKILRVLVLSVKGFARDKCTLRASALTFYSLISIVPVLAMAFGISKGFGFDHILEERVREQFQGQEEVFNQAIVFARNMLDNTKGGLIAGIGVIFLFWAIIKVLGNIERSFNDIWGIKKHRTLARKFSDYLSFMLIGPILFILAGSMTVAVTSQAKEILVNNKSLDFVAGPVLFSLKALPFGVLWLLFAFMYVFLPNGKVKVTSALLGGVLAGTIYQVVQWGYFKFQIGISQYNAIYGSFAALPLFLIWLQVSWLILLYGAEVVFAHQNVVTYEFEPDCLNASNAFKRLVTLAVAHLCVKTFRDGDPPLTAAEICEKLETPIRLVNLSIYDLVEANVLSEVTGENDKALAYQPALDIEQLTLQKVIDRLDHTGLSEIPLVQSEAVEKISTSLDGLRDSLVNSPKNVLLKDL